MLRSRCHIRERLTANRSDLTLQGGPSQHGTHMFRRTTRTNHSPLRLELQEPTQRHIVSRALRETTKSNTCNPFLRGHSTTLGVGCGFLYFRSKTVLGLPVSTTSYSYHAISTIQTWSAGPTTIRSSIDSDGAKTPRNPVLLPYLYIITIPRLVSYFHVNLNNSGTVDKYITYISRVTENCSTSKYPISRECKKSLDFYREVLSIAFLLSYTY